MLVFEKREGNPEYPEKNLSEQSRSEPTNPAPTLFSQNILKIDSQFP